MKILFNHTGDKAMETVTTVLVEIGNYGVSCVWYNPDPYIVLGTRMYHFQENVSGNEISSHLKNLFSQPEFLNKEIFVCLNVKESLVIPSAFFSHSQVPAMLDLVYGKDNGSFHTDTIQISNNAIEQICYNGYRIHPDIMNVLSTITSNSRICHSTSLQIKKDGSGTEICGIVYHHIIKLLLFKEGRLQLVQQFPYKTPADAAYLLLNASHQHGMAPAEVEVKLSGIIDKDSNLYREISKYFMHLTLDNIRGEVELSPELSEVSVHYFSHLTHLMACV